MSRRESLPQRRFGLVAAAFLSVGLLAGCGVSPDSPELVETATPITGAVEQTSMPALTPPVAIPPTQEIPLATTDSGDSVASASVSSTAAVVDPHTHPAALEPSDALVVGVKLTPLVSADEARVLLDELAVKGRAPKTGYKREEFGQRWSDDVSVPFGHNGCDTRNDMLGRDLDGVVFKPGTRDCVVLSGQLLDPYSGKLMAFERGTNSNDVHIDHVVALADAWQKGAQQLDPVTRQAFANDPDNLLAVSGELNTQKGASDAASWLPPNKSYRCAYAVRQIVVKHRYQLWVTEAEKTALAEQLQLCP